MASSSVTPAPLRLISARTRGPRHSVPSQRSHLCPRLPGHVCLPASGALAARKASPILTRAVYDEGETVRIPTDLFGGVSPERKASQQLQRFFTVVAVHAVLQQLNTYQALGSLAPDEATFGFPEGSQSIARAGSNHLELIEFYQANPLEDADAWIEKLMRKNKLLALQIMEVRKEFATAGFDWAALYNDTMESVVQGNDKIMQKWVVKAYGDSPMDGPSAAKRSHLW